MADFHRIDWRKNPLIDPVVDWDGKFIAKDPFTPYLKDQDEDQKTKRVNYVELK
jgi:hypothetical protein